MYSDIKHKAYELQHNQPTNPNTQHYSAGSPVLSDASGASPFRPFGLGFTPPSSGHRICGEHSFTSAFKGDHRSPPGVPPSRGTRHSHNTRQFVDSVAPQIDVQRNLQRASRRCSRMQIGLHHLKRMTQSHCRFFFVLKIMLVYARVWPETQAVAQKKRKKR